MSSLLIKDGTVINPAGRSGKLDVLIEDEKIIAVSPKITYDADEVIDAFGRQVAPISPYNIHCPLHPTYNKTKYAPPKTTIIDCATTEFSASRKDIRASLENDTKVIVKHISTADEVKLLRWAKENGNNIYAETTPYHFSFTSERTTHCNILARVIPPLRTERDRIAIINALGSGIIDMIATDYAPYAEPQGPIVRLEISLALGITELVNYKYLSLEQLITLMYVNRAKIFGQDTDMPMLDTGTTANIVIFDPYIRWGIYDVFLIPASHQLYGKVKYVIQNGQITFHAKSPLG